MKKHTIFMVFVSVLFLLFTIQSGLAIDVNAYAHWSFDTNQTIDDANSNDLHVVNAGKTLPSTTTGGILSNAVNYTAAGNELGNDAGWTSGNFTINAWVNPQDGQLGTMQGVILAEGAGASKAAEIGIVLFAAGTITCYSGESTLTVAWANLVNENDWQMISCARWANGTTTIYVNGTAVQTGATASTPTDDGEDLYIGRWRADSGWQYLGGLDEVGLYGNTLNESQLTEIYNNGDGCAYPFTSCGGVAPVVPDAYIVPDVFSFENTQAITVGTSFSEISSNTFNTTAPTSNAYFTAGITTLGTQGTPTATCRLLINQAASGSTATRTINNGAYGNFFIMSDSINLTQGQHNVTLECSRSVGGQYSIVGTTLSGQILSDQNTNISLGQQYNVFNLSLNAINTNIQNYTFTTSNNDNRTNTNNLHLLVDYRGSMVYAATNNLSLQLKLNNKWCDPIIRSGTVGTTGSFSSSCFIKDLLPNTAYTVQIWGNGSGSIQNLQLHTFEIISANHTVKNISLVKEPLNTSTLRLIKSLSVSSIIGGQYKTYTKAALHNENKGVAQSVASFYLTNGVTTRTVNRTLNLGSVCNCVLDTVLSGSGTTNTTISLYGGITNSNGSILTGSIISYVANAPTTISNSFFVYAHDVYNGNTINVFNVTLGNTTFTTTTGVVTISTSQQNPTLLVIADGYFLNTSIHDRTINLNASLVRWTKINVKNAATTINQFSVNYTNLNTNMTGSVSTTNNNAYIPLNVSIPWNVTVYDVYNGTVYFSISSKNITLTDYLQNLNFSVYLSNTFNITFYNESTNSVLSGINITVQFISEAYSNNYTTTTGTLEVNLLTPDSYTITYWDNPAVPREYYTTLTPQSYNNLRLYLIDESISNLYLPVILDETGTAVSTAIVKLLRYYIDINGYRTVEMAKTDTNGQAVLRVVPNTINYKLQVSKGTNSFETTPTKLTSSTDTYTLNTQANPLTSALLIDGVTKTLTYNNATRTFMASWSDTQNLIIGACLSVEYHNRSKSVREYYTCTTGASGSLIYTTLHNDGRYIAQGILNTSTTYSEYTYGTISINNLFLYNNFGKIGVLMSLFVFLVFSFMGAGRTEITVLGGVFALFLMGLFGFIFYEWTALVGMLIVGVIVAYKTRT